MRISLQMRREPFVDIFQKTLERFFEDAGWGRRTVRWGGSGERTWLCSYLLNAVFLEGARPEALGDLVELFGHGAFGPLQRFYAKLCGSRAFAPLLADAIVAITGDVPHQEDLCIFVGNNRIRVMDAARGRCWVLLKDGFPERCLKNEIAARLSATDVPRPRIREAKAARYFEEEYLAGLPLNRLAPGPRREDIQSQACRAVARWSGASMRAVSSEAYAAEVAAEVTRLVGETAALAAVEADVTRVVGRLLARIRAGGAVPLACARSHGDFQAGNIIVGDERYYVIDWECARERMMGYDGLVLLLRSRLPAGLAGRARESVEREAPTILGHWEDLDWKRRERRVALLPYFFLEELRFHAEFNANPRFTRPSSGVEAFLREADAFVREA